jgi:hypothetical protein
MQLAVFSWFSVHARYSSVKWFQILGTEKQTEWKCHKPTLSSLINEDLRHLKGNFSSIWSFLLYYLLFFSSFSSSTSRFALSPQFWRYKRRFFFAGQRNRQNSVRDASSDSSGDQILSKTIWILFIGSCIDSARSGSKQRQAYRAWKLQEV